MVQPTTLPPNLVEIELDRSPALAHATAGARVFTLLPALDTLVGCDGFGNPEPIRLPDSERPFDPWRLWARFQRAASVH